MRLIAVLALLAASSAMAQSHYVRPHVTRNGTYVQGHYQTNPDRSRLNNWSSQGNMNPYTGQMGTVNPYTPPSMPTYTAPTLAPIQPLQPLQPFQPYQPFGK